MEALFGVAQWEALKMKVEDTFARDQRGYAVYGSTYAGTSPDTTVSTICGVDCWISELSTSSVVLSNKIFGGTSIERPSSIISLQEYFVTVGTSGSSTFTEGSCNLNYSGAYISYLSHGIVRVRDLTSDELVSYPNPASDLIRIPITDGAGGEIQIISISGKPQYETRIPRGIKYIDVSLKDMAAGVYLAVWRGMNGAVRRGKVVKPD